MAQHMQSEHVLPEIILASSALRVQQTLQHMMEVWQAESQGDAVPEVLTEPSLYLASVREIENHIDALHDSWQTALVLGHNPGMGALVFQLAEDGYDFPTAAVAVFRSSTQSWRHSIKNSKWKLDEFWKPRELE